MTESSDRYQTRWVCDDCGVTRPVEPHDRGCEYAILMDLDECPICHLPVGTRESMRDGIEAKLRPCGHIVEVDPT